MSDQSPILVIGIDKKQEWMLPWWWGNFTAYKQGVEVIIVNLGLSANALAFCETRTKVVQFTGHKFDPTWLAKPSALLRVLDSYPTGIIAWMDIDCEIRGSLDEVFESLKEPGLHVTRDAHRDNIVGDGFCIFVSALALLDDWVRQCIWYTSSQRALNYVAEKYHVHVYLLPPQYHAYRMDGPDPNALVYHWTGPKGKQEIQQQMIALGDQDPLHRFEK